jgi:uncharacterized membrane protein YhaH (DUF805 family)
MNTFKRFYLAPWHKYTDFSGRAQRSEYWFFQLGNFIIGLIIIIFVNMGEGTIFGIIVDIISTVFWLTLICPGWAVTVRRLHDSGRSGWWVLICLVPLVGGIVLLVFTMLDSQPGSNAWGPNPKESAQG